MSRKLIVTLHDGSTEEFDLFTGGHTGNEYRYTVDRDVLRVYQGPATHVFPLVSIRKWKTDES